MTITAKAINIGKLRHAELVLPDGKLSFLFGKNAVGKTTLLRAVGAAAARHVKIYGATAADASWLVSNGADRGAVQLADENGGMSIEWPGGKPTEKGNAPRASRIAAGLEDPITLRGDDWRTFLASMMAPEYRLTRKTIAKQLAGLGLPEADAAGIAERLATGKATWDSIARAYDAERRAAQRAWEKIAGRRWGSEISAKWRPEGWSPELASLDVAATEAMIAELRQRAVDKDATAAAEAIDALHRERRVKETSLESLRGFLRMDVAAAGRGPKVSVECPSCGKTHDYEMAADDPPRLIFWKEPTKAEIAAAEKRRKDAQADIDRLTAELAALDARIEEARTTRVRSPESVAAEQEAAGLADDLATYRRFTEATAEAERARLYADVQEACGLNGIRRAALERGIKQGLNPMLAQWSGYLFPDKPVWIDPASPDFTLYADGMPIARYQSEGDLRSSVAIRACWLLQLVAASLDGSQLVLLDYGDVVVLDHLAGLMDLVDAMGLTALVAVTRDDPDAAAAKVARLAAAGRAHVVADGRVAELAGAEA